MARDLLTPSLRPLLMLLLTPWLTYGYAGYGHGLYRPYGYRAHYGGHLGYYGYRTYGYPYYGYLPRYYPNVFREPISKC